MAELDDAFTKLLGRQASDAERQRLLRVQAALGLRNNDALWLVLVALEHYQDLYEQIPAEIRKASDAAVQEVAASATAAARKASDQTKADLARALNKAVALAARGTSLKQLLQWALLSVLVVAVLLVLAICGAYRAGARSAVGNLSVAVSAQSPSAVERTRGRAGWAETPEGRLAYDLAKTGSLRVLARCEGPGWEVRGGKCYPQPLDGRTVFGWEIPEVPAEKH